MEGQPETQLEQELKISPAEIKPVEEPKPDPQNKGFMGYVKDFAAGTKDLIKYVAPYALIAGAALGAYDFFVRRPVRACTLMIALPAAAYAGMHPAKTWDAAYKVGSAIYESVQGEQKKPATKQGKQGLESLMTPIHKPAQRSTPKPRAKQTAVPQQPLYNPSKGGAIIIPPSQVVLMYGEKPYATSASQTSTQQEAYSVNKK